MPIRDESQLLADIATHITSDGAGGVTGADVRERLIDIVETVYAAMAETGDVALDELTDVVIVSPATGQYLRFNGTNWVNEALPNNIAALAGVTTQGILVWNNSGDWLQRSIAGTEGRTVVTNGDGIGGNPTVDLVPSGAVAGTYQNVTIDTFGRVTGGSNGANTTAQIDAHIASTANPHGTTAAQTGALVSVDGVANAGGNVDLIGIGVGIVPDNAAKTITFTVTAGNFDSLSDVVITSPTVGQVARYDGANWRNAQLSHTELANVGTNTHAQIDTHIASTNNPHGTTAAQIGALASLNGITGPNDISIVQGTGIAITTDPTGRIITIDCTVSGEGGGGGATSLDGLSDVTIASPGEGQILVYRGTQWVNEAQPPSGPTTLDGLTDVTSAGATDGQVLTWEQSTTQWKAKTPTGGGSLPDTGIEKVFATAAINFKTTGVQTLFTVPTNKMLVVETVEVISVTVATPGVAPAMRFGKTGAPADLVAIFTTTANATKTRESKAPLAPALYVAGEVVQAEITTASTAGTHTGVMLITGYLLDV